MTSGERLRERAPAPVSRRTLCFALALMQCESRPPESRGPAGGAVARARLSSGRCRPGGSLRQLGPARPRARLNSLAQLWPTTHTTRTHTHTPVARSPREKRRFTCLQKLVRAAPHAAPREPRTNCRHPTHWKAIASRAQRALNSAQVDWSPLEVGMNYEWAS